MPDSLEAHIVGAGVTSPFNTWHFEDALRQQVFVAVDRRQHEIEAYEAELSAALAELARVRRTEEARLASRVEEATARFHAQLEALQQSYMTEVEKLKRHAVEELAAQRSRSEAAIACRVRALQGALRHERPAGLGLGPGLGLSSAAAPAVAAAAAADLDRSSGGGSRGGGGGGGVRPLSLGVGRLAAGSPVRPYTGMRLRSSPTARGVTGSPGPVAGGARRVPTDADGW